MRAAELAIHRKGTDRFIESDVTVISLVPNQEAWVDGTKKFLPQPPRDAQRFKIIWGGESGIVRETPNGVRRFGFILVGNYYTTVAIGDTFSIGTNKFVIEHIFPNNGYEVKCGGNSHGSKPTG